MKMTRGTGKKGKSSGSGRDEEGPGLWKAYVRDVVPMSGRGGIRGDVPAEPARKTKARGDDVCVPAPKTPLPKPAREAPQLDARTGQRLRRGQVPIEGTLDLHGMTQQEAHLKLNDYIVKAHARKKRCVLVITGKGKSGEGTGVLRQKFPQWMGMPPLREIVLKIQLAIQSHGGAGAWYVYLKRQRDY
jgi:DNA-nicking Smr family endonuclease